jgi:NTE family protein
LQGLVGGFSLEAGRVDGPLLPNSPSGLLLASSIFVATDSPIGPVYVGLGHARSGSTALYFYLGAP